MAVGADPEVVEWESGRERVVRIIRRLTPIAACAYLAVVLAYWLVLRLIGEDWWLTTVALYLPHGLLLSPALPLIVVLVLLRRRRYVAAPLVAVPIILLPIMGLVVCGGSQDPTGTPRLRLMSYNVDSGRRSVSQLTAQIRQINPDIVVLQEGDAALGDRITAPLEGFSHHASGQFYIASRWPIVDVFEPPKLRVRDADRTPRFIRYSVATPLGVLDVINVHPISPRDGIESVRGGGLSGEIESGGIFTGDRDAVVHNTELRRAQAQAIVALAGATSHRVIIAGDTNLPQNSSIFADTLVRYQDGFDTVGRGFGYTFPAHTRFAWMRIDRILAGAGLRFLDFGVGTRHGSDHYCVWADLERWP